MAEEGENGAEVVPIVGTRCPLCERPAAVEFQPFCSKRCADLDLGRWFDGAYRIPAEEDPEPDDDGFMDE